MPTYLFFLEDQCFVQKNKLLCKCLVLCDPFSLEEGTYKEHYAKYCEEQQYPVDWNTFYRVISEQRPMLRSSRSRQDMCTVCFRLDARLKGCTDPVEKAALEEEKSTHFQAARGQRRAMNKIIRTALLSWEEADIGEDPLLEDIMDDIYADPMARPIRPRRQENDEAPRTRRTLVQCKDFGQGLPLPFFKKTRPGVDSSRAT